jgi:hypothetical protein
MQEEGMIELLGMQTWLKMLNLRRCLISDRAVLVGLTSCTALTSLDISRCPHISSSAVISIARVLPDLRILSLAQNALIDDHALYAFSLPGYVLRHVYTK